MTELLATAVDRLGVVASAQQFKQAPKAVQRPPWITGDGAPEVAGAPQTGIRAAVNTLANSAKRVLS